MKHLDDELCLSIKSKAVNLGLTRSSLPPNSRSDRPYSNNNLPYGYVCVLQHPKAADILLLLCSVFFSLHFVILAQRTFHQRDPNKIAVFLAAQKLLPMIDYIQTTHYHINQEPMRQCIYTAIQDSCNAPNRTYLTCTIYFKASFVIMYSLLHRNQRKRKKGEYFTA